MRTYEGSIKLPPNDRSKGRKRTMFAIRRGLKIVHIGDGVWRIGREKQTDKGLHQVIYSPDGKEYDLYDIEVTRLHGDDQHLNFGDDDGNFSDEAKVKIYILTNILDNSDNWCFDLSIIPPVGKLKVIYNSGTVKNIDFNGTFEKNQILRNKWLKREITPVGYRIN
jgi:hypothetical protein